MVKVTFASRIFATWTGFLLKLAGITFKFACIESQYAESILFFKLNDNTCKSSHMFQHFADFITSLFCRTQLCINTAIVYMQRFYMFHSFTKFHRNFIAAAALFLAAKVTYVQEFLSPLML